MKRAFTRGSLLTSVLIGGTLLGMIMLALSKMMSVGFRGVKHTEMKGDLSSLKETLRQVIDCDRTWATGNAGAPIVNSTDCEDPTATPPVLPKPITLMDRNGKALTTPLRALAGNFDAKANNFQASGDMGPWQIRTYCDEQLGSLVIRVARQGGDNGYYTDPLTKRPYDWGDSNTNPIFGRATARICASKFSGGVTTCPAGQFAIGFDPTSGNPICQTVPVPPPPPPAQAAGGIADKTCPVGQFVTGYTAAAGLTCGTLKCATGSMTKWLVADSYAATTRLVNKSSPDLTFEAIFDFQLPGPGATPAWLRCKSGFYLVACSSYATGDSYNGDFYGTSALNPGAAWLNPPATLDNTCSTDRINWYYSGTAQVSATCCQIGL